MDSKKWNLSEIVDSLIPNCLKEIRTVFLKFRLSSILAVKSKKIKTIQNEEKLRDSNKFEEIQSDKG